MTEILPTIQEIEALHRKYAPNEEVFERVWTHCRIVGEVALQLAQKSGAEVDTSLVEVGCLLHDIGVYVLYDGGEFGTNQNYITHGIRGEEILKDEGFAEAIWRFASHHTGAGITKEQIAANNLPLPHEDFLAETPEEELVMYADKFHSKTEPPYFNSHEYYASYIARFGEEAIASFATLTAKFGKPDLRPFIARYGHILRGKE